MAIVTIALSGFKDLGRSVTPVFLLMDRSMFSKKTRKDIDWKFDNFFFKMHHRIPTVSNAS